MNPAAIQDQDAFTNEALRKNGAPRRILHFAETLYGGIATYLNQLLPHQVAGGDEVYLFCPEDQQHLVNVAGVKIIPATPASRSIRGLVTIAREWARHHRQHRYDLVHLHSSFAGLIGRIFRPDAQIVYCAHGWSFAMDIANYRRNAYAAIERLLAGRSDAIVNISHDDQSLADAAGIPRDRSHVIHNGLGDRVWTPLPNERRAARLLFVGRYDRQKGFDLLLSAMRTLRGQGFALTAIGASIVGKTVPIPIPEGVTDCGWQSPEHVYDAMDAADAIVMPSRWEGFGLVAVEAMRAGRPVIAASTGGLREIIVDGETGILHGTNAADEIVTACLRLRDLDIAALGRRGRERYEAMFTSKQMAARVDALYSSLLA